MGRDDWYRNATWDERIEEQFRKKLARARSQKAQYLRIQAGTLAASNPLTALRLLDEYFSTDDQFDQAVAHVQRAEAYEALGKIDAAMASLEDALKREGEFPRSLTQAYLKLPMLIAVHRKTDRYERALSILDTHKKRLMFPIDRYEWHGVRALIFSAQGRLSEAKSEARSAFGHAAATHSGFQKHPQIGLVREKGDVFYDRLATLTRGTA